MQTIATRSGFLAQDRFTGLEMFWLVRILSYSQINIFIFNVLLLRNNLIRAAVRNV